MLHEDDHKVANGEIQDTQSITYVWLLEFPQKSPNVLVCRRIMDAVELSTADIAHGCRHYAVTYRSQKRNEHFEGRQI